MKFPHRELTLQIYFNDKIRVPGRNKKYDIVNKHTGMSLSMVLGIPAIATFRPRRLTSYMITKICSECLLHISKDAKNDNRLIRQL